MRPGPDDPLGDVKPCLIGFAVVAYCRCFLHSNVRAPLGDYIEIPPRVSTTHELVRNFRNQTIAHSQSELAVTYPIAILNAKTMELQSVSALTIGNTLPDSVLKDFVTLVGVVLDLVDQAIVPVRERLEETLRSAKPGAHEAAAPRVIEKMAGAFQPRSKRGRYPTQHTIYWDREK